MVGRLAVYFRQQYCNSDEGGSRRAGKRCKVLMMMVAAELGWAVHHAIVAFSRQSLLYCILRYCQTREGAN